MSRHRPQPPDLDDDERAEILARYAQLLPTTHTMTATQRAIHLTERVQELEHELRRTAHERLAAIADLIDSGECTKPGALGRMLGLNSPGAIWPLFRAAQDHLAQRPTADDEAVALAVAVAVAVATATDTAAQPIV